MSHHHAELIFPPTDDINGAVAKLMNPFDEDGESKPNAFWDFYVIGGRFSGAKIKARFEKDRMEKFRTHVTVSSVTCGKQELQPATQIPMVDAMWSEMFPEAKGRCPIFNHYNDQYKGEAMSYDLHFRRTVEGWTELFCANCGSALKAAAARTIARGGAGDLIPRS